MNILRWTSFFCEWLFRALLVVNCYLWLFMAVIASYMIFKGERDDSYYLSASTDTLCFWLLIYATRKRKMLGLKIIFGCLLAGLGIGIRWLSEDYGMKMSVIEPFLPAGAYQSAFLMLYLSDRLKMLHLLRRQVPCEGQADTNDVGSMRCKMMR